MKEIQFSLLVLVLFMTPPASANPPWVVRTWQSDEGLPDNTVIGIDQTPDGFLWVATKTGLVRFDGLNFREFQVQMPGMASGMINGAFCIDRRGRLWIGKEQGAIICLEQGRMSLLFTPDNTRTDWRVKQLVEDGEGAVWALFAGGNLVRLKDASVRFFTTEDGLPPGRLTDLAVDARGQIWIHQAGWPGVFREGRFHLLPKQKAARLFAARAGGVWMCTSTNVTKYTEAGEISACHALQTGMTDPGPSALYEDRAGRLWIGTRLEGLYCYDGANMAKVDTFQQPLFSIKEDQEGNIWVGTRGGGLKQLKPRVAELLTIEASTPFQEVQSICKDKNEQVWAVTWPNGTVVRNVGKEWIPLSAREGWTIKNAACVAADPQGGVWIGTDYEGLYHWHEGVATRHVFLTKALDANRINALRTTERGTVWVGARRDKDGAWFLLHGKNGSFRSFSLPPDTGRVSAIEVDGSGDCWAATIRGVLVRVRGDVLTVEAQNTLTAPHAIRALLATPDKSLWIGYAGIGLGRLKDGRLTRFRMSQGLHDDYISHILSDGRGRLWLAGNRGIFSVREKDLDELAAGRVTQVQSMAFTQKDGLTGLQASYDAWPGALRDTDGRLLFAMQSGVAVLYADEFQENIRPPLVVIDRVSANGKVVALYWAGESLDTQGSAPLELGQANAHLRLPPGPRQVEFSFTAPGFTMPESIGFKYRLQGLDTAWVEAGARRSILYSQLAPGRYQFQVVACNRSGLWNKEGTSLALTVAPFWWETAWFRVAGLLGAFGLLGGAVVFALRRRHRYQLERLEMQQATERERARIARDMHDDLGSHLTRIVMLSDSDPDSHEGAPATGGALAEINQTGREMTLKMSEIVWALNPAHDSLDSFAGYVAKRAHELLAAAKIHCRLDLPLDLPASPISSPVRHEVLLAFKEALHNIVKHARATSVLITLRLEDASFVLTVKDDGKGFAVPPDSSLQGHGLANMKHRLAEAGGLCEVLSQPGEGTRIRFTLPLSPKR